jgi:putative oxidoreductase
MSSNTRANIGLFLARIPLGAYFLLAGLHKITGGVSGFVSFASKNVPQWMPPALGKAYLYALPFVELIAGAMVILGLFTRFNALIQALILTSILIAMGIYDKAGGPFHPNLVFLGLALMLAVVGGGDWSVDRMMGRKKQSKSSVPAT